MTTIDIQFKMSNPDTVQVRIMRDEPTEDGELVASSRIPRISGGKKPVHSHKSAGELIKSPSKRLKNQSNSIDVSEMFYSGDQFTITAYLPNEDLDGEKQTRLKIPCYSGMTVQQVIENQLPNLANTSYFVYQFPSKALLNPERDASVLQGQEIWIEPSRMDTSEDTSDRRLAVVKEFYRTEDAYLEHLRNIFDVYMEPLSTWGISQSDMNTLFLPLSRLCDLLMNFFSELELAVKSWNTHTTLVGGIFKQYHSFWEMYIEYAQNYTVAMRLLKEKRKDESFNKFLDVKRGAAMHTLESLMLLPVQRVTDYNRYLTQLLALTTREHRDYQNIRLTLARTEEIIQARADELVYLQNESKLEQVQLQFPNDHLNLSDAIDLFDQQKRRTSTQTPTGLHKHTGALQKTKSVDLDANDSIGSRKNLRMYIQEGPVKLTRITMNKQIEQERYLFLFSDLLIVAKPKAGRTHPHRCYRLKKRLKLGEMWIAEYDSSYAHSHRPECSFIIGWPLDNAISVNCIATFGTEALKSLWFAHISKHIQMQRKLCISDSISTHILNMTKFGSGNPSSIPEFLGLHVSDSVEDVIKNSLNVFDIKERPESFQLWVKLPKEDRETVLLGIESPFAIQDHFNKLQMEQSASDIKPQQLEFVLKRKVHQQVPQGQRPSLLKMMIRNNKKRSGIKPGKEVKMFGVPLDQLIVNNQLPERLQEILVRLWVDAPTTFGIFRQSPSIRKIREVREAIDENLPVDFSEVSLHVIGALLKDLLRNVPHGVIPSQRYTEFVATNDINEYEQRIQRIRGILSKLPAPNQTFLRYLLPLLSHISHHEEENGMSSTNLAICFAPSLLEPDLSLSVIKNEAPTLVDFMITHAPEIYNFEVPDLFKRLNLQEQRRYIVPVKDEDDTEMSEDLSYSHRRETSLDMCTSADSEDSVDEDESPRHNSLLHTSSDSNVPEILSNSGKGRVTLLSDRSEEVSTGIEGDQSDMDEEEYDDEFDSTHRPMQSRLIRTRHGSGETSGGRRRTIGTQSVLNQRMSVSPYTPNYSPKNPRYVVDSMDSDMGGYSGNRSEPSVIRHNVKKKKRNKPGQSHSFSKSSDLQHSEAKISQSSSITLMYDSLSPVAGDRPRSRSMAVAAAGRSLAQQQDEDMFTKSLEHTLAHNSNQSISSRTSGSSTGSQTQSRGTQTQSDVTPSFLSGIKTSSTPDPLTVHNTSNKSDDVKMQISNRFGLGQRELKAGTMYDSDVSQETLIPGEEDYEGQKLQRGPQMNYPYTKDGFHEYPSSQPVETIKRVESVASTTSIDDRPEAERHFNGGSLPRVSTDNYKQSLTNGGSLGRKGPFGEIIPLGHFTTDSTGSHLTISSAGGYNSDTESSPSRTLNRQDMKMQEVSSSSPQTIRSSVPYRYSKPVDNSSDTKSAISEESVPSSSSSHNSVSSRGRSSTFNQSTFMSSQLESKKDEKPSSSRLRSTTMSYGSIQPSIVQQEDNRTKNKRTSTYEVYQKRYEEEKSSRKSSVDETTSSSSSNDSNKLSSSLEVAPTSRLGSEEPPSGYGSKILSLSSKEEVVAKSRSMPDYSKRQSVTRTLTTSSTAVKTVKVIRYDLPTPKKIRRINLRAYNTSK